MQHHLNIIRTMSINYHISQCYNNIRNIKRELYHAKQALHQRISDQFLFLEVLSVAQDHNNLVKQHYKDRLQKKYDWLIHKYSRAHKLFGHSRVFILTIMIYVKRIIFSNDCISKRLKDRKLKLCS